MDVNITNDFSKMKWCMLPVKCPLVDLWHVHCIYSHISEAVEWGAHKDGKTNRHRWDTWGNYEVRGSENVDITKGRWDCQNKTGSDLNQARHTLKPRQRHISPLFPVNAIIHPASFPHCFHSASISTSPSCPLLNITANKTPHPEPWECSRS